jgi:hypothetical protein
MSHLQKDVDAANEEIAVLNRRIFLMQKRELKMEEAYESGKQSLLARYREQQKGALEQHKLEVEDAFQSGRKSGKSDKSREVCFMLNRLHFKHKEAKWRDELNTAEERAKAEVKEETWAKALEEAQHVVQDENRGMFEELRAAKRIATTLALVRRAQARKERTKREEAEQARTDAERTAKEAQAKTTDLQRAWAQEEHTAIVELTSSEKHSQELTRANQQIEAHQTTIDELKKGHKKLETKHQQRQNSAHEELAAELKKSMRELQEVREEAEGEEMDSLRLAMRKQSLVLEAEQRQRHEQRQSHAQEVQRREKDKEELQGKLGDLERKLVGVEAKGEEEARAARARVAVEAEQVEQAAEKQIRSTIGQLRKTRGELVERDVEVR